MPYKVEKKDGYYCVVKTDDGKIMGEHPTMKAAQKQIFAIEQSEKERSG